MQGQPPCRVYLRIGVCELAEIVSSCDEIVVRAGGGNAAALQHDYHVCAAEMLHLLQRSTCSSRTRREQD